MAFGAFEWLANWLADIGPLCLAIGLCSGFLAGLLGIGGGTIVVPALILGAPRLGIPSQNAAAVAIATSMAVVLATSLSSARAHAARGSVHWSAFRRLAPGVAAGALAGTALAGTLGGHLPVAVFIGFMVLAALRLMRAPGAAAREFLRPLPPLLTLARDSLAIGLLSALAGIGGGVLSVPWLSRYVPWRCAIGTGAALGLPLAVAGLAGYLLSGRGVQCAAGCIGSLFVPGALGISLAAIVSAPLGALAAHQMPVRALRRVFAALMLLIAADLSADLVRSGF